MRGCCDCQNRMWVVSFLEFGELLYGRRFLLSLKWAAYESYIGPSMLYGGGAWCLNDREMGVLRRTERSMVSAICGVDLKDRKRSIDLILILKLLITWPWQTVLVGMVMC